MSKAAEGRRLGDLRTPEGVGNLREALHAKAKAEPEFRFYALYDKLYRADVLEHAYARCRANKGAPGVDGLTFEDVARYGPERWLGELAQTLKDGSYRPKPIRRVYIPKANGKMRPLGISCLADRVCMMAATLILEPIFESDLQPEQYAYRKGHNAHGALSAVTQGLRDGYTQVVDADLEAYFDSIEHAALMRSVARRVVDRRMLALIKSWLECVVEEAGDRGKPRWTTTNRDTGRGIPQGSPLSPLLANLSMRRVLLGLKQWQKRLGLAARVVTYADDLVILCRPGEAHVALEGLRTITGKLGLAVNEAKTRICTAQSESFDFLGYTFARMYSPRTGNPYYGLRPSRKSMRGVVEELHAITDRKWTWKETADVVQQLNRVLRGWANYFSLGTVGNAYRAVEAYCTQRLWRWLLRKHKQRRSGRVLYPYEYLFETLGLERLSARRSNWPCAKA
ncbi:group II intron reverse transcriptase/maturase [Thiomonas sp. FB-Cd]|uniref:group II intron reverse transcriptase/maturase n=1 Tax=Thiomonas sp. FB-Cd TaxID=1158292 RepID=UPI001E2F7863|nr:group II intron reverse transcriptase/maturase [Thiomonas sp. FB-Cd]